MTHKSVASPSLSERLVINYHKHKKHLTKFVIARCIVIAVASCLITYYLTSSLSEQTIIEVVMIQVIFAFLSLLATFTWSPRFILVMSVFAGIGVGALIRAIGL